jgi:hypothetical protein
MYHYISKGNYEIKVVVLWMRLIFMDLNKDVSNRHSPSNYFTETRTRVKKGDASRYIPQPGERGKLR